MFTIQNLTTYIYYGGKSYFFIWITKDFQTEALIRQICVLWGYRARRVKRRAHSSINAVSEAFWEPEFI